MAPSVTRMGAEDSWVTFGMGGFPIDSEARIREGGGTCRGVALEACGSEGRKEMTRTVRVDEREMVRRRPGAIEADYKRFNILAMFCS